MSGNCGGAPNPNYDGGLLGPGWNNNSGSTSLGGGGNSGSSGGGGNDGNSNQSNLLAMVDNLAWEYIPSAYGIHWNMTFHAGGGLEGNYTPMELMVLFNWRSGELSLMVSMEGSAMLTVPDIAGVSINVGITEVYGANANRELTGWSNFLGSTVSVGEGLNAGVGQTYGIAKDGFLGEDHIDPVSNRPVTYKQSSVFGEANIPIFVTPVDGAVLAGTGYTAHLSSVRLPNWPFR